MINAQIAWDKYLNATSSCQAVTLAGKIVKVAGIVAEASGPCLSVGSLCEIETSENLNTQAEVIGFNENRVIVMPFGEMRGIRPGSRIAAVSKRPTFHVGESYLGRVIDGIGRPIDGKGIIRGEKKYSIYGDAVSYTHLTLPTN